MAALFLKGDFHDPDYNQIWKPAASCYGTDLTACTVWSVLCLYTGYVFWSLKCEIKSYHIVLAYFIYFGVPYCLNNMIGFNFTLTALQAGTVCLALNCGAYMAEIIRAGILSVDSGQMEAARSLGLPYSRAMIRVVLPQAIRTMIPSIINQFIITLKDTSILSVIGFPELVNTAKNVVANSFMSFQTWGIVAVMYLIVITILSKVAKIVERRLNRGRK